MFVVGIGEGVCVYLYMRIYGLIVLNGWSNGVVTIVDEGCCGCGGGVDGRKSGGWAAPILSLWREGGL